MDELTFIRSFGHVETAASPLGARAPSGRVARAHRTYIVATPRSPALGLLAVAFVTALLVAGSAFAWKGPLRGLFEGQPAPPKVKEAISKWNKSRDMGAGHRRARVPAPKMRRGCLKFRAVKLSGTRARGAPRAAVATYMFIETRDLTNAVRRAGAVRRSGERAYRRFCTVSKALRGRRTASPSSRGT